MQKRPEVVGQHAESLSSTGNVLDGSVCGLCRGHARCAAPPIGKLARKTKHIERCTHTLRQRVSRLVRRGLSFAKQPDNHIGAIKYCFCNYNLLKAKA